MTRWRRCLAWLASALAVAFSCGGALAASPEEVVNQMWCPVTKTCMQWSAAPGATQYLLYRGTAGQLPALLNATTDSCTRIHNAGQQSGQVLQESPPAGGLFWYLVTASNSCGEGSPGSASAGPRIRNSTTSCTATCFDSVRNALETDVDCGGPDCVPCTSGQMCAGGSDCENGICNGRCPPPRCMDGVRNGTETDVDCGGGSCNTCGNLKVCCVNADCTLTFCSSGVCRRTYCGDGVANHNETDVDCGGVDCAACTAGKFCGVGSDCQSGVCTSVHCQAPTCTDGVRNGTESDIDCGGGGCPLCANGKLCNAPGDCASSNCPGINCQPYTPTCTDGIRNGSESDVDCGGTCTDCASGRRCNVGSDCQSGVCVSGICQ